MLEIRQDQMKVFEGFSLSMFVEQMMNYIRNELPEVVAALKENEFRQAIHDGIHNAEQYRISDRACVEQYLWFYFQYGLTNSNTHELSWIDETLESTELTELEKILQLEHHQSQLI